MPIFLYIYRLGCTVRPRLSGPRLSGSLVYPDPSPSGRKSLVTDVQHMLCIQHNRTSRSAYRCMILCTNWLKCVQNASSYPVACGWLAPAEASINELYKQMRSLTCWVCADSTQLTSCMHLSFFSLVLHTGHARRTA